MNDRVCIDRKQRATFHATVFCILLLGLFFAHSTEAFVVLNPHGRLPTSAIHALKRKSDIQKKTLKGKKWDRRRSKNGDNFSRRNHEQQPKIRPILCDYDSNKNDDSVRRHRLSAAINCEHFKNCAGCVKNDHVGETDIIRSAKLYFSSTAVRKRRLDIQRRDENVIIEDDDDDGFLKVVIPSNVTGWRTQAKLAVAPKSSSWSKDGCSFGLYQRGTHDVLTIPQCQVHHPSINRAIDALSKATSKVGTAAYSSESREGGLRYVQCQVERTSGRVCLSLVWASSELKYTQPALSRLTKELARIEPNLWHSMWCHCNDSSGNNIFSRNSRSWSRLSGAEFVREPIPVGNVGWLYFSPLVFRQGNLDGFDILANDVAQAVPEGSKVCELYAGVGMLGLTALAHHAQSDGKPLGWVRCSDENPSNQVCFSRSLSSLPSSMTGADDRSSNTKNAEGEGMTIAELVQRMEKGTRTEEKRHRGPKASYMVATAADALFDGQALGANVLIVDPPRRGLEDEVLIELCKPFDPNQPYAESSSMLTIPDEKVSWTNDIETLIYVSCGFDALARDCERLLSSRAGWMLESATGYVLFPGSDHVETICVFKRG